MSTCPIIFVVDDESSIRDAVKWLLESDGHQVMTYCSAERFLEALSKEFCKFCFDEPASACLVLDLKMPGMDGLELQSILVQRCPCLPVIFVSGHANEQQIEQAMEAGAIAFLAKPFDDKLLLGHIQQMLRP